jgi:ubiquitin-activating enzyme E1 C
MTFPFRKQKLQEFIDHLINDPSYQMKSPGVTTSVDGRNKTLYMSKVASIEEATRSVFVFI